MGLPKCCYRLLYLLWGKTHLRREPLYTGIVAGCLAQNAVKNAHRNLLGSSLEHESKPASQALLLPRKRVNATRSFGTAANDATTLPFEAGRPHVYWQLSTHSRRSPGVSFRPHSDIRAEACDRPRPA